MLTIFVIFFFPPFVVVAIQNVYNFGIPILLHITPLPKSLLCYRMFDDLWCILIGIRSTHSSKRAGNVMTNGLPNLKIEGAAIRMNIPSDEWCSTPSFT